MEPLMCKNIVPSPYNKFTRYCYGTQFQALNGPDGVVLRCMKCGKDHKPEKLAKEGRI